MNYPVTVLTPQQQMAVGLATFLGNNFKNIIKINGIYIAIVTDQFINTFIYPNGTNEFGYSIDSLLNSYVRKKDHIIFVN
jgi:hypothetical protein